MLGHEKQSGVNLVQFALITAALLIAASHNLSEYVAYRHAAELAARVKPSTNQSKTQNQGGSETPSQDDSGTPDELKDLQKKFPDSAIVNALLEPSISDSIETLITFDQRQIVSHVFGNQSRDSYNSMAIRYASVAGAIYVLWFVTIVCWIMAIRHSFDGDQPIAWEGSQSNSTATDPITEIKTQSASQSIDKSRSIEDNDKYNANDPELRFKVDYLEQRLNTLSLGASKRAMIQARLLFVLSIILMLSNISIIILLSLYGDRYMSNGSLMVADSTFLALLVFECAWITNNYHNLRRKSEIFEGLMELRRTGDGLVRLTKDILNS